MYLLLLVSPIVPLHFLKCRLIPPRSKLTHPFFCTWNVENVRSHWKILSPGKFFFTKFMCRLSLNRTRSVVGRSVILGFPANKHQARV